MPIGTHGQERLIIVPLFDQVLVFPNPLKADRSVGISVASIASSACMHNMMEHDVIQITLLKLHAFAGDVITRVGQSGFTVQINFVDIQISLVKSYLLIEISPR